MRRRLAGGVAPAAALAAGLLLAACAGRTPPAPEPVPTPLEIADQRFDAADWQGAAAAYAEHLESGEPAGADRARFRLALIELSPGPASDPAAGLRRLRRLVDLHPGSPYRPAAELLLRQQAELERLRRQIEALKKIDLEPPDPPG